MLANVVENIVVYSRTGSETNEVVEHIKEINNEVNVLGERCDESQINMTKTWISTCLGKGKKDPI
jgi:hypothetical protein